MIINIVFDMNVYGIIGGVGRYVSVGLIKLYILLRIVLVVLKNTWYIETISFKKKSNNNDNKCEIIYFIEAIYLFTDFVPSDCACFANSPGNTNAVAAETSLAPNVLLFEY